MAGKLIVLEGIDGSGKSTQFKLLTERLRREGVPFRHVTFPRYNESSSTLLRSYLGGEFGSRPEDVSAFAASTFFFVDRYASYKTDWGDYYKNGGLLLCDRYTTSNAIHQGAKLPEAELPAFLDWLYDFEFRLMELPRPDVVLYMDIDLNTCMEQMRLRQQRTNTTGDIHEVNPGYLASCLKTGSTAASRLGWNKISCINDGSMRSIESIHEEIYNIIKDHFIMVFIILANGFEDAEAFVPLDILIRGGAEVRLVSNELTCQVTSARGITFYTDYVVENVIPTKDDTLIIPGGTRGVAGILSNRHALDVIYDVHFQGGNLAAICAGPTVLAHLGLLDGKNATCYPGCEKNMAKAVCHPDKPVVQDGSIITSRAASSSFDFGFAVLEMIKGRAAADKIRAEMVY